MHAPLRLLSALAWTLAPILAFTPRAKAQLLKPDLSVASLLPSSASLIPGGRITLKATVKNSGLVKAGSTAIAFYVDNKFVGARAISSLGGLSSTTASLAYTVPYNVRRGRLLVRAYVDYLQRITESDETNNSRYAYVTGYGGTDLYVSSLSLTTTGGSWAVGSQGRAAFSIMNRGYYSAVGFTVGFYLSRDTVWSSSDRLLRTYYVSSLPGNTSRTVSLLPLSLPPNITPGRNYLIAVCDNTRRVTEFSETNNTRALATFTYLAGRYIRFGVGCRGSNGTPSQAGQPLAPATDPHIGASSLYVLSGAPKSSVAIFMLGVSKSAWGPFRLPLDMRLLGAPGCSLLTGPMIQIVVPTNSLGTASIGLALPKLSSLVGANVYTQFACLDSKVNTLGLTFSSGVQTFIGSIH